MAKIIFSDSVPALSKTQTHQVYNSLDSAITYEVWKATRDKLDPNTALVYNFSRALQAPALEMMLRGIKVDQPVRNNLIRKYTKDVVRLEQILNKFSEAVWGTFLNANSPQQLKAFFYTYMGLPEVHIFVKGARKVSTSREALEKLSVHLYARPIISTILALRDAKKKLSVLKSGVDKDGRMRCSFNICGTETGRWSSSKNAFGTGMNLQNPTDSLRRMFVADPGMKLGYIDLEQAESRAVAYLSGDEAYIYACESGDLHTTVCEMVWTELGWHGELKTKKSIANQPFYRHFTYRDMAKRGGHGTNYYGKPWTMARHLKVDSSVMEAFQRKYFSAFPGIPAWHQDVARRLQLDGFMITPFGRTRYFFGRHNDDSTLREAIAFEPQSTVGDCLNLALLRVWQESPRLQVQCLSQLHDAILIQFPEELEDEIIPKVMELMLISIPIGDRILKIPCEAQTGWNWAHYNDDPARGELNLGGIKTWTGNDNRTRPEPETSSILDRLVSPVD